MAEDMMRFLHHRILVQQITPNSDCYAADLAKAVASCGLDMVGAVPQVTDAQRKRLKRARAQSGKDDPVDAPSEPAPKIPKTKKEPKKKKPKTETAEGEELDPQQPEDELELDPGEDWQGVDDEYADELEDAAHGAEDAEAW